MQDSEKVNVINAEYEHKDNVLQQTRAIQLAKTHDAEPNVTGKETAFLKHSAYYTDQLNQTYQYVTQRAESDFTIHLAGEWLLDNFYIVQEAMRQIEADMPQSYYRQLPKLNTTQLAGYPRVFAIARAIFATSNHALSIDNIQTFLHEYQTQQPLSMGEIWALPTMLRIVSLENLIWAVCKIADNPLQESFYDSPIALDNLDSDTIVANAITSLRTLATENWNVFFESVSRVNDILNLDPAGVYVAMDFETRNRYRKQIETYTPMDGQREEEIAQIVIELAQQTQNPNANSRTAHIGYYLIDGGIKQLEDAISYQPSLGQRITRLMQSHSFFWYISSIMLITVTILALLIPLGLSLATFPLLLLVSVLVFPVSVIAVETVNWFITQIFPPCQLPRMDYSRQIAPQYQTIVAIPAMLTDNAEIEDLVHQIEQHYIRNYDEQLVFALLLDYADASDQHMADDNSLRDYAIQNIRALNQKYGSKIKKPFYLFIRERLWNESEQTWMAWERKRGKLSEFNRFILDPSSHTNFVVTEGNIDDLRQSRYVITLDADTILPKGEAARLIATMAHPLNQPVFNEENKKITAGYAIMQPRVQIMPHIANQSRFTRIFAGDTNLDLYTLAVSDVYQDCFKEGIYIGKGIYDIRAFEEVLKNRVPENRLLSHDLFESNYARTALVTDIVLLEDYPPHYLAYNLRLHRWIRGDWQLFPWLLSRKTQFSGLGYWKVFDNLRRSLLSPTMLFLLILAWTVLPGSPILWTGLVLIASGFPFITTLLNQLLTLPERPNWQSISHNLRSALLRWVLYLVFLPHDALIHIDAIMTTLWRLIRRKRLLKWVSASHTIRLFGGDIGIENVMHQMHTTLVIAGFTTFFVALMRPMALFVAFPFVLAWLLSLPVASYLSKPIFKEAEQLNEAQQQQLYRIARRTWLFFEKYAGPEDNWLPPDHYQEAPREVIAHHTSPTNIGLLLLSTLAAYDFGYIGLPGLLTRIKLTFETLDKLERYRGHFLNWYDTRRLVILSPRYVSTVDSGNLVGLLIALKAGLQEVSKQPIMTEKYWSGLADTVSMLTEMLELVEGLRESPEVDKLLQQLHEIRSFVQSESPQFANPDATLHAMWEQAKDFVIELLESTNILWNSQTSNKFRIYYDRVNHHIETIKRDGQLLLPWRIVMRDVPEDYLAENSEQDIIWQRITGLLDSIPSLKDAPTTYHTALMELETLRPLVGQKPDWMQWCDDLAIALKDALQQNKAMNTNLNELMAQIDTYIEEMDFTFLFNDTRKVFHIGYSMEMQELDNSFYDLLASEARIASLVAIATNQVPQEHWLHLSRPLININGIPTLKSWSGTMFEYLMPALLMHTYPATLIDYAYRAAVDNHISYGQRHNMPWGISESGFYAFDSNMNYQYHAFGAPELAFKRGIGADRVISPYSTFLALAIRPQTVMENVANLNTVGAYGTYGYYEAIDYTKHRLPLGKTHAIVQEYMAHHQGMIMLSLLNFLQGNVMISRFHANPYIESVELLLQEHMPTQLQLADDQHDDIKIQRTETEKINTAPWQPDVEASVPQVHFLSNGRYGVLLTSTGAGFSQWKNLELTRWYADTTLEDWGMWIYLLDEATQDLWSITHQPAPQGSYRVWFHPHQAEFRSEVNGIVAQMQITVAPDDDVEIRRVRLTNNTDEIRQLYYTSYGEVVLAPRMSDQRHPAFSKLFIETEYVEDISALLYFRRKRAEHDKKPYLLHMLFTTSDDIRSTHVESDRRDFIGRNHTNSRPISIIQQNREFDGVSETTIDPIMALGHRIDLQAHEAIEFAYITMAGETRASLIRTAQKYRSWSTIDYAFSKARYHSELELQQLEIDTPKIEHFQTLFSALLYPQPQLRAESDVLAQNERTQSDLWAYGVSGDYPICLVRLSDKVDLPLVQDLLEAHLYWRKRNIQVTLIILNQRDTGYTQELYNHVKRLVQRLDSETWLNRHDGIFILRADQMDEGSRTLLFASARVYLDASKGSLQEQLDGLAEDIIYLPQFIPTDSVEAIREPTPELKRPNDLLFDNGYGGFDSHTEDYIIFRTHDRIPPAPWINVIANADFGFSISESGGGFTWAVNSSENRLTAWQNDPVKNMPSENLYVRDEETGAIWSPTPLPATSDTPYLIRHSKGYTQFKNNTYGLEQELTLFVDPEDPVKIMRIQFKNHWNHTRRLTITYYAEWVLGTLKDITQQYIIPEYDADKRTLLAHNPYTLDFGDSYMFVTAGQEFHGMTTDRREFLGRLNDRAEPAGLQRLGLGGAVNAGDDTCVAVQLHLNLAPGKTDDVYFVIGGGISREKALALSQKYQQHDEAKRAWHNTKRFWDETMASIQIDTPEPSMNLLLPWLHYQALSCRIWGRSALYQSGGAYGFRDQLQDVMSVIHSHPDVAREHIRKATRHQFAEGDVLHWWHPPSGRGVRTRFSDDLIWLPFVTAYYVTSTGDTSILEEREPFLSGSPLQPDEEERYDYYKAGDETFTIYEHCRRALERAKTRGRHGLPLMGSGDWNDGMSRVGIEGEGESVWVAWFLIKTMRDFIPLCEYMNDDDLIAHYHEEIEHYLNAIEANAWDGNWYRRAYYDDGTPLGSSQNEECMIDSLSQSWSILAQQTVNDRSIEAMQSVLKYLWKPEDDLLLLFTPPFNQTEKDPGYIKGYPPGVRENGGQYTHAAIWTVWAFAKLGDGERAESFFRLLNPILHSATQADAQLYRVEPYVIAADVYSAKPYVGMGGWTWYTGSSGWMYRLGIEAILGIVREGDKLLINPSIPSHWDTYRLIYKYGKARYHIEIQNPDKVSHGVIKITVDEQSQSDLTVALTDDNKEHQVVVLLGKIE